MAEQDFEKLMYLALHDLREPLRTMSSYCQILKKHYQGRLDADGDKYIKFIVGGAERMQALLNSLAAYVQVNQDNGCPAEPTDLRIIWEDAVSAMSSEISEAKAQVTAGSLPLLKVKRDEIKQLFTALLSNALKFRSSSEPVIIDLQSKRTEQTWLFSLKDNGLGIDSRYHNNVFEMFRRLHSKDEYPGSGLGLAICKKIVEAHGGRIWVTSTLGEGSTFHFELPQ